MMESYVDKIASMEDEVLLMAALSHGRALGDGAAPPLSRPQDQAVLTWGFSLTGPPANRAGAGALAHREIHKRFGWTFHSATQLVVTECLLDAMCFPGLWG